MKPGKHHSCAGRSIPAVLALAITQTLTLGGCATTDSESRIRLHDQQRELSVTDPEGQARDAVDRGEFDLFYANAGLGASPTGVYCSFPLAAWNAFRLGTLFVSDIARLPDDPVPAVEPLQIARQYNRALVEHSDYPYRDVCRIWREGDSGLRSLDDGDQWYREVGTHGIDATYLFDDVRPGDSERPARTNSLAMAARLGRLEDVREWIAREADTIDVVDGFGMTPLAWAVARGHEEVVSELLGSGAQLWPPADVNSHAHSVSMPWGDPLYLAVLKNQTELMAALSETARKMAVSGSDQDRQPFLYGTLRLAATVGDLESAQLMVELGARMPLSEEHLIDSEVFRTAVIGDQSEVIEYFLSIAPQSDLSVPFFVAAEYGSAATLARVLDRGADVSALNWVKYTVLDLAVMSRRDTFAKAALLLESGADLEPRRTDRTTLMNSVTVTRAGRLESERLVRLLHRWGAELDAEDGRGCTALLYALNACQAGQHLGNDLHAALPLIELGAGVNVVYREKTPLDYAYEIRAGRPYGDLRAEIIAALLAAGAATATELGETRDVVE